MVNKKNLPPAGIPYQTVRFARWLAGVTKKFYSTKPFVTSVVIACTAIRGVLQLLAFMVPLKVIFIAASPQIPSYFDALHIESKGFLIGVLALTAVAVYISAQALGPIIEHWSLGVGGALLRKANDLPVHSRDKEQAQKIYIEFTSLLSALLFLLSTAALLVWLNLDLMIWLGICLALLYICTVFLLDNVFFSQSKISYWIKDNPKGFTELWETFTFFGAFFVILWPFATNTADNAFIALISFILIRRMISELGTAIRRGISLSRQRPDIDAVLYRGHVSTSGLSPALPTAFNRIFNRVSRQKVFTYIFREEIKSNSNLQISWVDSVPRGVKRFIVTVDSELVKKNYDVRIFGPETKFQVKHSDVLFQHISRDTLHAPSVARSYDHDGFLINITTALEGTPCAVEQWEKIKPELVQNLFSVAPPAKLIRSYRSTHPILPDRINETLSRRIEIAIDNDFESELFERWIKALPEVILTLKRQPLVIVNPDLHPSNVIISQDGSFLPLYWGRWRLDTLGAGIFQQSLISRGPEIVEYLKTHRYDMKHCTFEGNIEIGILCQQLEHSILAERGKESLDIINKVLTIIK